MASLFAIAPPGFEMSVAKELRRHKFTEVRENRGGVAFVGHPSQANTVLACPSRILQRVGRFKAFTFAQLERGFKEIDWSTFGGVTAQVSCHGSRLYHSDAIRERIAEWVPSGPLMLQARIVRNRCIVSIDTSGELLHRRGWRLANGPAPIRENLAACILEAAHWRPGISLYDPMCGSGTFLIESARQALGLYPGQDRTFPCSGWAPAVPQPVQPSIPTTIGGSDHSAHALKAAIENAARAGVDLSISRLEAQVCEPPSLKGLLVANPPYGRRARDEGAYVQLGNLLNGAFADWDAAIIYTEPAALAALGRRPSRCIRFRNGGLHVSLAILPASTGCA